MKDVEITLKDSVVHASTHQRVSTSTPRHKILHNESRNATILLLFLIIRNEDNNLEKKHFYPLKQA